MVTRPLEQARRFAERIEAAGGRALVYPGVEIDDLADSSALEALCGDLDRFDLAIFVSPTAVRKALAFVRARRPWPASLPAAAVGRGTQAELEREGIPGALAPETGADSEALLALPALSRVKGRRIVVFRGEGGRALLGETLKARGALVQYAACYRRAVPRQDLAPLLKAWSRGEVDALACSSSAALENLFAALGAQGPERLRETPVFVSHPRIAEAAKRLGAGRVVVGGPGDEEMLEALVAYFGPA